MRLHENRELFGDVVKATAQAMNISFLYVEKDYLVTYILKALSQSEHIEQAIFKGGTALSKAYQVIERFSEDIDLAVISTDMTSNQTKKLIKRIEKSIIDSNFREIVDHIQVSKGSEFRKTVYDYAKLKNNFKESIPCTLQIVEKSSLIQKPKQPKRNFFLKPYLYVI